MQNKTLSVILLSYYSGERIGSCYKNISEVMQKENIPFELIVMDDGSKDNSYALALELEKKHENVRAYQLSRNYTSHYSIFAGLSVCKGACAIPIADDEQQPYSTLVDMYRLWEQGHKVIIPHRISRDDPWLSKTLSKFFYNLMNRFSDITYPPGGADSFFIDREIIDIINTRIHPINTATIVEVLRLGFSPYFYGYERPRGLNGNKSRWSLKKKLKLAKDTFFSSSDFPIKAITRAGFLFAGLALLLILFYGYIALFGKYHGIVINVPGWLSIILCISFFSGIILVSLGVLAEYILLIFEEVKNRPGYIIKQKDNTRKEEHDGL